MYEGSESSLPEYVDMHFPWLATTVPLEFNSDDFVTSTPNDDDVEAVTETENEITFLPWSHK